MTALLSFLGSKDFHLSSIIQENSGITMYLWTYLAHSAGKTLCMTVLWFSLNTERSSEKNTVRKYCTAFSNLEKFWQGKLESCTEREKEQELDLPTEQIPNCFHYFLSKATNKKSPYFFTLVVLVYQQCLSGGFTLFPSVGQVQLLIAVQSELDLRN